MKIVQNKLFEFAINALIIFYCVEYTKEKANSTSLQDLDKLCLYIFIAEYCLKYMAFGLFEEKNGILRDNFNIYDITIVLLASIYTFFLKDYNHYNLLIFRFVKIIKIFPSKHLTIIFEGIFSCILQLSQIYLFFVIFAASFSFVGMVLFSGSLQNYCLSLPTGLIANFNEICGEFSPCSSEQICVKLLSNIDNDVTSFNDFEHAFLQVLRIMTFDNWSSLLKHIRASWYIAAYLYFIPLTVFGNFLVINMFLAVLKSEFEHFQQKKNLKPHKISLLMHFNKGSSYSRSSFGSFLSKKNMNIMSLWQKNIGPQTSLNKFSKVSKILSLEKGLPNLAILDNKGNGGQTYRRFLMKMLHFEKYSQNFASCFDKIYDVCLDIWENYMISNIIEFSQTKKLVLLSKLEEEFYSIYDIFPFRRGEQEKIFIETLDTKKRIRKVFVEINQNLSKKAELEKKYNRKPSKKLLLNLALKRKRKDIAKIDQVEMAQSHYNINKRETRKSVANKKEKTFKEKTTIKGSKNLKKNTINNALNNYDDLKILINEKILETLKDKAYENSDSKLAYYEIIVIF